MTFNNKSMFLALLLCVLSLVSMLPVSRGEIVNMDEYLERRANVSYEENLKAYHGNPEEVTENFNLQVTEELISSLNGTRRSLTEKGCEATNPIDRCWRCDPNWARNRKQLATCARGFGYRTTGGKRGAIYVVTDPSDNDMQNPKRGTLRHAIIQDRPLWIIFASHMVIRLKNELIFTSDKTIDGRGADVHIAYGAGLTIQYVRNIIIHNVWIHDIYPASGGTIRDSTKHMGFRTQSDGDAISIYGSSNVWIDHVSLSKAKDGLIDVIEASTAVTISNCKFNHHNDVMLLGANDASSKDKIMQVTVAFNRFGEGLIQRMPRCRWGFFHVVNNDYSHWELYAIGGSAHPTIISQGNRFRASNQPYTKEVTKRDYAPKSEWMHWQWRSEGDVFQNGAFFTQSGVPTKYTRTPLNRLTSLTYQSGSYISRITRFAGARKCRVGKSC